MTDNQSKAFDIIKISAAIIIVARHCHFVNEWPLFDLIVGNFSGICIPLFFMISSYLFIIKFNTNADVGCKRRVLRKSLIRLAIFFGVWYILMIPWTWERWFSIATYKETITAILFHCTCSGLWFIKALIFNMILIFFCNIPKRFKTFLWFIAICYYIFTSYNYIFHFINIPFSPYFHFAYHIIPCLIGLEAAEKGDFNLFKNTTGSRIVTLLLLYGLSLVSALFLPIFKIIGAWLICSLMVQIRMPKALPYKSIRKASILFFMLQFGVIFSFAKVEHYNPLFTNSIVRTVIVLSIVAVASIIIIRLSSSRMKFLRYLY